MTSGRPRRTFSAPQCPACGGKDWQEHLAAREFFTGDLYPICRCVSCGCGRTVDVLSPEALARAYNYGTIRDAGRRFIPSIQWVFARLQHARIRFVHRIRPSAGRVLDVGCGSGAFLTALAAKGWNVWGTELDSDVAASAADRLNGRVLVGSAKAVDPGLAPFDLAVFWHVLEHLEEPREELAAACRLLGEGGRILVAVPNGGSWQARLTGRHWLHLDVPRHRWHFSWPGVRLLAQSLGMQAERINSFSFEHGGFGMFQSLLARVGLGHTLFTNLFRGSRQASGRRPTLSRLRFVGSILLMPLLPLAFLLEAVATKLGRGGVLVIVLSREPDSGKLIDSDPTGRKSEIAFGQ